MKSNRLFEQGYYKQAASWYYKEFERILRLTTQPQFKREYVIEQAKQSGEFLQNLLVKGYKKDKENLLKEQQKLITQAQERANKLVNDDPSRELLRRQDYQLELANADQTGLIDIGERMLQKEVVSRYDYLQFKQAAAGTNNNTLVKIMRQLEQLTPENVAKNSEEYKELQTNLGQQVSIRPNMLWLDEGGDNFIPTDYKNDLLTIAKKAK